MRKIILAFSLAVVCFLLCFLMAAPVVNSNAAKKTAQGLVNLPLPENTECIEAIYKAGKLVGNGNGMQYFGAILIKSELSLEELKEYYSAFAEHEWECVVEEQTGQEIKVIEHAGLTFKTYVDADRYYIVYSWGDNNTIFHEFDIRGH